MRMRRTPGARERLHDEYGRFVVDRPETHRGHWRGILGRDRLEVELGAGKGQFIVTKADRSPDVGYVAVEREPDVLLKAARKASRVLPDNLLLLHLDVDLIAEAFEPREVDRIYLNFSDPWPKNRHAKRRLTHRVYLDKYAQILAPGGEIHFKTDNEGLFEYSLEELSHRGWRLKNVRLHYGEGESPGDVPTEYEERFRGLGQRIFRLEAFRGEDDV